MTEFEQVKEVFYAMNEQDRKFFNHSEDIKEDISFLYLAHRSIIPNVAVCELFYLDIKQVTEKCYVGISVMVNPLNRQQGVATRLFQEAIDFCKQNNISAISADIYEDNHKMKSLLEKMNFKRDYAHNNMVVYTWINEDKFKENTDE